MKSIPLSVRVSEEDAAFLARYESPGAVTPSEKLRALVSEARRRAEGAGDFSDCAELFREMFGPAVRRIGEANLALGVRSELVGKFAGWLAEAAAQLVTSLGDGGVTLADLRRLEAGVADRQAALLEDFLRLGVTSTAPCYDPGLVRKRLSVILELAALAKEWQTTKGAKQV